MKTDINALKKKMLAAATDPGHPLYAYYRTFPCVQVELLRKRKMRLSELDEEACFHLLDFAFLEEWIDSQDVMHLLHISPRTLQTLRTNGILPFSRIGNKIYYLRRDISQILQDNYTMYKIRQYDR